MSKFEGPKFSSIDRYFGGTSELREQAQEFVERIFEAHEFDEIRQFERPKTPAELEMIGIANYETDKLREKYGLPSFQIPPDNFHLIMRAGQATLGSPAGYSLERQAIAVVETETRAGLLHHLAHESTHFKTFNSVKVGDDGMFQRQVGLSLMWLEQGRRKLTFSRLNEAVTEAVTKRVMHDIEELPILADEMPLIREVRAHRGDDIAWVNSKPNPDGPSVIAWDAYTYGRDRQALDLLINKLVGRSPEVGENYAGLNYEGWFDEFAKAMFTGDLTTIGRAVERTFGKGTYKKLGEPADGPTFLKLVESL